jgi:hypothetical protein
MEYIPKDGAKIAGENHIRNVLATHYPDGKHLLMILQNSFTFIHPNDNH